MRYLWTIITWSFSVLFVVVVIIFNQNIEEWSSDVGLSSLIKRGASNVSEIIAPNSWQVPLVAFVFGCAFSLWLFGAIHKFLISRAESERAEIKERAEIWIDFADKWWDKHENVSDSNIYSYYYTAHTTITFFLVFDTPVKNGLIGVFTSSQNLKWKQHLLTDRSLVIELIGDFCSSLTWIFVEEITDVAVVRQSWDIEYPAICRPREGLNALMDA